MIDVKVLNRAELAALVCETLSRAGIDAVLVGGSCVSIYTHEKFVSLDLDFIALGSVSNKMIGKALAEVPGGDIHRKAQQHRQPQQAEHKL